MNDGLNPEERDALADALREHLLTLRRSILETSDAEEKLRLKAKEEILKQILEKLEPETSLGE